MKKRMIFFLSYLVVFMVWGEEVFSQTPTISPSDWKLVFNEEFTGVGVDDKIWRVRDDYARDAQVYRDVDENVRTENGSLILNCLREAYMVGYDFTSGRIDLRENQKYGFFEIQCRLPIDKGMWPAFWFTHTQTSPWPPEIDIFETYGPKEKLVTGGVFTTENDIATKTFDFRDESTFINETHRYGLEWTSEVLNWYIDDVLIATTTKDVPTVEMTLAINLAVNPGKTKLPNSSFESAIMEVDYVKIWKRVDGCPELSWNEKWISSSPNQIDTWNVDTDDKYVVGDYDGDNKDELLFISENSGYSRLYSYDNGVWCYTNSNHGSGLIGGTWLIGIDDKYVVGDYDGDNKDELLFISENSGYSRLYSYDNGVWSYTNSNHGSGLIGETWLIGIDDKYVVGDYDGDNKDELLFISENSGYSRLYSYDNGVWSYTNSNHGSGLIGGTWVINPSDRYISGDYNADGIIDILFLSPESNYTRIYDSSNWSYYYSNHGNTNIHNWAINNGLDRIVEGKFDNTNKTQLLIIRHEGENENHTDYDNSIKARMYEFLNCNNIVFKGEKVVNRSISEEKIEREVDLIVEQNPVDNECNVLIKGGEESYYECSLWNNVGQLILTKMTKGNTRTSFDTSALHSGIYFLQIMIKDERVTEKLLIIH